MSKHTGMPSYPRYPNPLSREQGISVTPYDYGPPSMRPGGMNPRFTNTVQNRSLGSDGGIEKMHAEGIDTYPNELDLLATEDDVAGNGVFDPNLTHGQIHPDAGIFAERMSLPGYVDREKFYSPSEVTDITTGTPVNYVPSGAVAFQEGQTDAFNELQNLFATPPRSEWQPDQAAFSDTWIPQEPSRAIGVDPAPAADNTNTYVYLGIGIVAGAGLAYLLTRKR